MDERGLWNQVKILFIQETDWLKRGPHQQHFLADNLSMLGHDIKVIDYEFTWRTEGKNKLFSIRTVFNNVHKIDRRAQVTVIRPGIIKIRILDYVSMLFTHWKEITRQLNDFKPDVIVCYGVLNAYLTSIVNRRYRIPFVYYWIDVLHRLIPIRIFQFFGKILEKETIKRADRILVINAKLKDYVIKFGAPRELTKVVTAGIDTSKFDPELSGNGIRQEFRINADDKVIFFMGWLYQFSGLKEVALKLSESKYKQLKLLIVGDGDAFTKLKKIQQDYDLLDAMILTGKQPYQQMPSFIAAADICILPSYPWEPIIQDIVPIKLYEYMAMKKPVISTKLPGVMSEFGSGNGIVYVDRPDDVIAKAIELITSNKLRELGDQARSFVEKNSWTKITHEFEKILQEVIEEKGDERIC